MFRSSGLDDCEDDEDGEVGEVCAKRRSSGDKATMFPPAWSKTSRTHLIHFKIVSCLSGRQLSTVNTT